MVGVQIDYGVLEHSSFSTCTLTVLIARPIDGVKVGLNAFSRNVITTFAGAVH